MAVNRPYILLSDAICKTCQNFRRILRVGASRKNHRCRALPSGQEGNPHHTSDQRGCFAQPSASLPDRTGTQEPNSSTPEGLGRHVTCGGVFHLDHEAGFVRGVGCIDRPGFGRGASRIGLFTDAPYCAIKCSTLMLGFRSESLHQGLRFESHLHHRKATLLTYAVQNG